MGPRLVVLGWDSATFDLIDSMIEAGRLPHLTSLIERGVRAPLRSTWPPMTDCAWTSAFTGRNPGAHGIFGSWYRAPGKYACRYFSARDRRAPAVWELTQGVRHLVWNVPMTYPPERVEGAMVAGYGAPPGSKFTSPADLQGELSQRWPLDDLLDRAPHSTMESFLDDLLRGLDAQAEALPWAADRVRADAVYAVWPHVDRAQHFFWRYRHTHHPLADAIERVYEAMDRATGACVAAFPDADVLVVSDHGAGPLKGDINIGAWLAHKGYASYSSEDRASVLAKVAWSMPPAVRRAAKRVAPGLAQSAMEAKLAGDIAPFDWSDTKAFLGVHSDLWLNVEGREPEGSVDRSEAAGLLDELRTELLELRDARTGEPVVAAVHGRDDIYSGPSAGLAPDAILDTWTAGYRIAPGRAQSDEFVTAPAALSGVDAAWSSDHRPLGVFVAAGSRIGRGNVEELSLYDVCPLSLALLEQAVPDDLDGRADERVLDGGFLERHPVRRAPSDVTRDVEAGFSEDEAAAVAAHLKDLGYIE